jgi:hypothetical protein
LDLSTDCSVRCNLAEITINKKHKKNKRFNWLIKCMFVSYDVVFFVQLLREFHETNGKKKFNKSIFWLVKKIYLILKCNKNKSRIPFLT